MKRTTATAVRIWRGRKILPVGTRLEYRRQHVAVATATVAADGIHFGDTVYTSLSSAGSAAAKSLGMHESVSGTRFWFVVLPDRLVNVMGVPVGDAA